MKMFNYNSLTGIFHPGTLNTSQYLVNNYSWDICCNSVARKGIFEEQGAIADKTTVDYFVYPNPNSGNDNLFIIMPDDKPTDISITDAIGKLYYSLLTALLLFCIRHYR